MTISFQQITTLIDADSLAILTRLTVALIVGGIIGFERSFHGHPAGFRTHTLVCLASSLLMLVTYYTWQWMPSTMPAAVIRTDPTRLAQGIMTGIGFLGAGVIYKEGLSVRGLTTAASIWITAAIGILIGVGFYFPVVIATLFTLGTLALFRWIENKMPANFYAHYHISFNRDNVMPEEDIRALLLGYNFTVNNMRYRTSDDGRCFEYRMVIGTTDYNKMSELASYLRTINDVKAFRISRAGG